MAFLSEKRINQLGFQKLGRNVQISDKASIYQPHLISLGDNVRIDDFVVISPSDEPFVFGSYIHIASHCTIIGRSGLTMKTYSGLSGRVSVYTSSDDYSGDFMTNPTVPKVFTNVISAPVLIGKHVIVGAGSVILPGVSIGFGSAISALALVTRDVPEHVIAGGIPCRVIKTRGKKLIELEKRFDS
ncbi:MAG: acyltransferase [Flavobacteriales bacterium]|nr:acyltransferase [Flavobacteriales bacterium]